VADPQAMPAMASTATRTRFMLVSLHAAGRDP